jgi:hypothetical protein
MLGQPRTNAERSTLVPADNQLINETQLERVEAIVTTSADCGAKFLYTGCL